MASFVEILLGVLVVGASRVSAQTTDQPVARVGSPFRSGTELVPLQVAVVDGSRRYVPDLLLTGDRKRVDAAMVRYSRAAVDRMLAQT